MWLKNLRRHDDIVATTFERFGDDRLGLTARIRVGRVDKIDAGVERAVNDAHAVVVIGVAHRSEHHCAEAVAAHDDAGLAEIAIVHGLDPSASAARAFSAEDCLHVA